MTITPAAPQPRTAVARWQLDAAGLRIYDRTATLIYGGYDSAGARVDEFRVDLSDTSTPPLTTFLQACPAAATFKQQAETFGATLAAELGGTVS